MIPRREVVGYDPQQTANLILLLRRGSGGAVVFWSWVFQTDQQPVFNLFGAEVDQQRSLILRQVVQTGFNHDVLAFSDAKRDSLSVLVDLPLHALSLIGRCVVQRATDDSCFADGKLDDAIGIDILFAR